MKYDIEKNWTFRKRIYIFAIKIIVKFTFQGEFELFLMLQVHWN
jgi:hypothetical protein